jgi:hypothetical protein
MLPAWRPREIATLWAMLVSYSIEILKFCGNRSSKNMYAPILSSLIQPVEERGSGI